MSETVNDTSAVAAPPHAGIDRRFALRAGEPLPTGLRRIALGQIYGTIEQLDTSHGPLSQDAVHEARKSLKRLRALTRLLRDELGDDDYERENEALRDTARRLAGARDADVMVDAFESLLARHLERVSSDDFAALRAKLAHDRAHAAARLLTDSGAAADAIGELRAVRGRVTGWRLRSGNRLDAVEPGLRRIYRQGRRRYREARDEPTAEHLHDWRKRVKDLRYCAELLAPADPAHMARVAARADRLGETLGEEHDMSVLADLVRGHRELFDSPRERKALLKLIDRRRHALQRRALRAGKRLYRPPTRKFVKRAARGWRLRRS